VATGSVVIEEREGAEDGACVVICLGFDDKEIENQEDEQERKALPMDVGGGVEWWQSACPSLLPSFPTLRPPPKPPKTTKFSQSKHGLQKVADHADSNGGLGF